ncbi:class I SAM-dependent methyltransferase [Actinophytocola sediminis]
MTSTGVPALLASLRGTVLEIGPGAGANLAHYPAAVRWIGVEPDLASRSRALAAASRLGRQASVLPGVAERLAFPDHSVDAVVGTYVLCSVDDQAAALAELYRVLRPGGRYVFAEHVAAPPGTWLRRGQRAAGLLGRLVGARCRPDRDTLAAIERAGFDVVEPHHTVRPGPFGTSVPNIAGIAIKEGNLS